MRYVLTPDNSHDDTYQQELEWRGDGEAYEDAHPQQWEDEMDDGMTAGGAEGGNEARPSRPKTDWDKVYESIGILELVLRLLVPCAGLCACWPIFCWVYDASPGDDIWFRVKVAFIAVVLVGLEFWFGMLSNLIWQVILFVATKLEDREEHGRG